MKKALKISLVTNGLFIIGGLIFAFHFKHSILARIIPPQREINLVVYGDSRVQMGDWETGLHRPDVFNAGIGGTTTAQLLDSLQSHVINLHPKVCVLQCGINDIRSMVALETTIKMYSAIIDTLVRNNIIVVISSIIPVSKDPFQYQVPDELINNKVDTLNIILRDIAKAKGVEYLDLNRELAENKRFKLQYTLDGVHVNPAGFEVWYKKVEEVLGNHHL